jgi:hypothetical protein
VSRQTPVAEKESAEILLGLLESVERDGARSQRRLAAEVGVALGLVNAYLRRCIRKGLVKVREVPTRRYAYYLTSQGFAEKSRLTVKYLTYSLSFFREAKADCQFLFEMARQKGLTRVILFGRSDLAEIAIICALECEIEVVAVVDPASQSGRFVGAPLANSFDAITSPFDAVVITDLLEPQASHRDACRRFGEDKVFVPRLLRLPATVANRGALQ